MKLRNRIQLRLFVVLSVVMAAWAVFFYQAIVYEINDETDDSLEDYTEIIVKRFLRGDELPDRATGSNNQYYIARASSREMAAHSQVAYCDSMVFIPEKNETEPARILTTYFKDRSGQYYRLQVFIPTFEKSELKESIWVWMVVLYFALLLTVLIVNMLVFYSSMKPFYRIIHWLEAARVGERKALPDTPTHTTEFVTLHHALDNYTRRAEQAFEQQKEFIGNASHELQTPLAICLNRMEFLLEDTPLSELQMEEILKMQGTLSRMSRLNKNLLLLSKLDNGQYPDSVPVPLNAIVRRLGEDLAEVYAHQNINLKIEEKANFGILMDETLGTLLVSNLLKNAYVHNRLDGGQIRVDIGSRHLCWANTGESVALDATLIFQRFYHRGGKSTSTGLGLAIAQAIAHKYGLELSYRYADGWHFFQLS